MINNLAEPFQQSDPKIDNSTSSDTLHIVLTLTGVRTGDVLVNETAKNSLHIHPFINNNISVLST